MTLQSPEELLATARHAPDAEAGADLVLAGFDDPIRLARQLWDWTRRGALNTAATYLYWKPMAADASAFTAADLLDLLVKIGEEPECAGLSRRGRVLPAGWRKELDALLAAVRAQPELLIAGLKRLREPLYGGLAFALARDGLLPAKEIPERVFLEMADKVARGDDSVRRDILAQPLPWPRSDFAEATARAALNSEGRVDGLEDFLCQASAPILRQLFEKRAFGALEAIVKAADKTRTWLEDHLAELTARPASASDYDDSVQRRAALAAWSRLSPAGSLPVRFEPLIQFALAAHGPPSVSEAHRRRRARLAAAAPPWLLRQVRRPAVARSGQAPPRACGARGRGRACV
ncbi:MAG: hypothetical protein QM765_42650 [Myxococcales bacterium]